MDMGEDSDLAKMMLSYKGLYVSSSLSLYNSWIINKTVRENLSDIDRGLVDYAIDWGNSFGIGAGYQFTPNFGVEAEMLRGILSQDYDELTTLYASNQYTRARSTYLYVPISLKYQIRRSRSMNKRIPRTFSTVLGMHYGRLQDVDLQTGREIPSNTESHFIQQELGVFTGVDWHLYLSPNIHVTLGGRVAAGTDFEYLSAPFAAGTPYNVQAGMRVGLNYRFATRKYKWDRGIH